MNKFSRYMYIWLYVIFDMLYRESICICNTNSQHELCEIFFRLTALSLGQSYDCLNTNEVILKHRHKICFWNPLSVNWVHYSGDPGPRLNIKTVFPGIGISMLKIRRLRDRLIFNMGIPILVRRCLYTETNIFTLRPPSPLLSTQYRRPAIWMSTHSKNNHKPQLF